MRRCLLAALIVGAVACGAFAQDKKDNKKVKPSAGNILLVVTNNGRMGDLDKPTGYWLSEVSHAWTRFIDAGYDVTFASPEGGVAPMDPRSFDLDDPDNERMWARRPVVEQLADTKPLGDVVPSKFKAVYFAGGHGTMWDFPDSAAIHRVTSEVYENGGLVAAVCHGPAALVNVKTSDGKYLVDGKKMAAFTNAEETSSGLSEAVPFLLQSKLKERGAEVETAPNYEEKVVVDGRLVTGQNPASAAGAAEAVVKLLKK